MSEQLKQMAAVIRDETQPSANTARRIGQCFEGVIDEHDAMAARLPETRVPPLSVDISQLDLMTSVDYAVSSKGAYFLVYTTYHERKLIVGTLQMFSDSLNHVLTQIFITHAILQNGTFNASHDHHHIQQFTRSYGLTVDGRNEFSPGLPEEFPLHGWGKWRPMTALAPNDFYNGMDGLMSATDKQNLDKLHKDWGGFKIKLL